METGDVVVFSGNTIYHERISPGASSIIYLKLNDLRLDPSCEDPHTAPMRARSIRLLEDSSDEELLGLRTLLSPRLEGITCRYTRHHWMEVMEGRVAGEETFGLCEIEWKILRLLDDRIDEVRSLIARAGFPAHRAREYASMIRRLVQVGALELHTV